MAEIGLAEVTKSFRSAMGETAGTFRKASNDNNANISKITKDLSKVFAQQRAQIAGLNDNIEEVAQHAQQTSVKVDKLATILGESVAIQNQMYGELKKIAAGISILDNTMGQLQNSVSGLGPNSVTGWLGKLFGVFQNAQQILGDISGGIAGLAGASMIAGQMSEGGGATGGATTGPVGKGFGESGSSSEAMQFFQSKGWTKEQSAGIVGNLQQESGKNLRTNVVGDSGQAYGIAQWHPDRQRKFQEIMGIPIRQSNFKQQLEFVQWELTHTERRAGEMLKAASTAIEAAKAVDYGYERSAHQQLGERMANAVALAKSESKTENTKADTKKTPESSGATPKSEPMSSTKTKPEEHKESEHPGIISGAKEEKQSAITSGSLPGGDIVALGKALRAQGLNVTGHSAFPPVGKHTSQNSAHYKDMAIDINVPGVGKEVNNPEAAARFDKLADALSSAGYNVLWRSKGHDDHIHAQLGGSGVRPGSFWKGGAGATAASTTGAATASATTPGSMTTPGSAPSMETASEGTQQVPDTSAAISKLTGGADIVGTATAFAGGNVAGLMGGGSNLAGVVSSMIGGGMDIGSILSMMSPMFGGTMPEQISYGNAAQQLNTAAKENEVDNFQNKQTAAATTEQHNNIDAQNKMANAREGYPLREESGYIYSGFPDWLTGMVSRSHNPLFSLTKYS